MIENVQEDAGGRDRGGGHPEPDRQRPEVVAIAAHNLPEGFAVGAGFGGGSDFGWVTALSIGIQNVPEGLIVAIPCTVIFSMFRQRIDRLAGEVGEIADSIAADLSVALDNDLEQPADRAPQKQLGAAVS